MNMDRRVLVASFVAALLVLTACGSTADTATSEPPAAPSASPTVADAAEEDGIDGGGVPESIADPCSIATDAEIEAIFGHAVGAGETEELAIEADGAEWTTLACRWIGGSSLAYVAFGESADFAGGAFRCPAPPDVGLDVDPLEELGAEAWWVHLPEQALTSARVCSESFFVDIILSTPADEATARSIVVSVAGLAVERHP